MIRRDVLQTERDHSVVKWLLIAAVFALTMGCYADLALTRDEARATASMPAPASETAPPARIAG